MRQIQTALDSKMSEAKLDADGLKAREKMFADIVSKYGVEKLKQWGKDPGKLSILNAMAQMTADSAKGKKMETVTFVPRETLREDKEHPIAGEEAPGNYYEWPHVGWWKQKEEIAKRMDIKQLHYARLDADKAARAFPNSDQESKYRDEGSIYAQEMRRRGQQSKHESEDSVVGKLLLKENRVTFGEGPTYMIGARGLEKIGDEKVNILPKREYWLGASSSPDHIVVTAVDSKWITFMRYPYQSAQKIEYDIGKSLIDQGSRTHLATYGKHMSPADKSSLDDLLRGGKGREVDPGDFKRTKVTVKFVGKPEDDPRGDKDGWYAAEHYGGVGGFKLPDGSEALEIETDVAGFKAIQKDKLFKVIGHQLESKVNESEELVVQQLRRYASMDPTDAGHDYYHGVHGVALSQKDAAAIVGFYDKLDAAQKTNYQWHDIPKVLKMVRSGKTEAEDQKYKVHGDNKPYTIRFTVGGQSRKWVRYSSKGMEDALASAKSAIAKEFPGEKLGSIVIDPSPVEEASGPTKGRYIEDQPERRRANMMVNDFTDKLHRAINGDDQYGIGITSKAPGTSLAYAFGPGKYVMEFEISVFYGGGGGASRIGDGEVIFNSETGAIEKLTWAVNNQAARTEFAAGVAKVRGMTFKTTG